MYKKTLAIGFISSNFLSIILISIIGSYFETETSFFQFLLIFCVFWTVERVVGHILIFGIYFLIVLLLDKKIKSNRVFYLLLLLAGAIYLSLFAWINWNHTNGLYKTFEVYLIRGSYYLIYAVVVVLVLSILGVVNRRAAQNRQFIHDQAFRNPQGE